MKIDCGGDVFMGDNDACGEGGFAHVIHFVRTSGGPGTCRAALKGSPLILFWTEGDPIEPIAANVMEYARDTLGPLLIHCESGHHRAPHGALLACLGRGVDPLDAMRVITLERFRLKAWTPDWRDAYLNVVMELRQKAGFP